MHRLSERLGARLDSLCEEWLGADLVTCWEAFWYCILPLVAVFLMMEFAFLEGCFRRS